jgi:hypothetical protein
MGGADRQDIAAGEASSWTPSRSATPSLTCRPRPATSTTPLTWPFVPVSDLSPSQVLAAWPEVSRSRAVAGFVRAAAEVAASHADQAAALA